MKLQVILIVTLAVIIPSAISSNDNCDQNPEWQAYKAKFNKKYSSKEEENRRCLIWQENYDEVQRHNADKSQTYRKAVNHFADQTLDERKRSRGLIRPQKLEEVNDLLGVSVNDEPPAEWDWRDRNAVTPVKSQGGCGSCWSFAGVIESQYYLKTNKLVSFSEQQLIDCDNVDSACKSGWPYDAFKYLRTTGGLETAADYPYAGKKKSCKYKKSKAIKMKVTGIYTIKNSELTDAKIQSWIYNYGPLSVTVCTDQKGFDSYDSGIYKGEEKCKEINHAVLLVGYVNNSTSCYYIIKNSWGASWGMGGYMNIACGSRKLVQHPTVAIISV